MATLHVLSGGAAQGLVRALETRFAETAGAAIAGRFGAVGAMKESLLAGEPCDLMITTGAMVDELVAAGQLRADARSPLGRVRTGIAVRRGDPLPDASSAAALKAALRAADAIHFPDPQRATAGIHFANVLRRLGIHDEVHARCLTFPNGAAAMRALASSSAARPIGCTQLSEILATEGIVAAGPLPDPFGLETVYTAAVTTRAAEPALALRLVELLAGEGSRAIRGAAGFES